MSTNGAATVAEDRPISEQEASIVNWLLRYGVSGHTRRTIAQRTQDLKVVGRCTCGCASVDFEMDDQLVRSHPIAEGVGGTPGGSVGLILWGREDCITGLEVYSMEDTTYCTLPAIDTLLPWPQ